MKNTSLVFIVIVIMAVIGFVGKSLKPVKTNTQIFASKFVTPSLVSTITPQYQLTAQSAQYASTAAIQTSDAAMLNILALTAQRESVDLQYAGMTQSSSILTAQADQWTATAAPSAVPGTQTASALDRAIAGAKITQISVGFTAAVEAPTQMIALQRAQDAVNHAPMFFIMNMFALGALIFCLMGVGAFAIMSGRLRQREAERAAKEAIRQPVTVTTHYVQPEPVETVLEIKRQADTQYSTMDRMVIPCSREQFSKLVTGILRDGKSMAFEHWNKRESPDQPAPFTRDEFILVRNWMQSNKLAQSVGGGALILSAEGESIFIEWLNSMTLPAAYTFMEA